MRLRIEHATTYAYDQAARSIMQTLRLTPRSSEAQQVRDWRVETDVDARLHRSEDAFGNVVHTLYTEQPTQTLTVQVFGEVETTDTAGILPPGQETLSPLVFLRDTTLTRADRRIAEFVGGLEAAVPLDRAHSLMARVHAAVAFEVGVTNPTHTAAEVLELGRGVCQDHAHVFIAGARRLGLPARYVSGHLMRGDGQDDQEAAHAWAEAWIEDLGWIGFDPANGICVTERYVRVATGLDYLGAAPVRGASYGGGGERMSVRLSVRDADAQQSQQQA
jgi:transglutaminase-like putative cysteine protease